jgi:hypothetical protein
MGEMQSRGVPRSSALAQVTSFTDDVRAQLLGHPNGPSRPARADNYGDTDDTEEEEEEA